MYFEFCNPGKILSGHYALENIASEMRLLSSSRALVLSDRILDEIGAVRTLTDALTSGGMKVAATFTDIPADSDISVVNDISAVYRSVNADCIIALGGGSVIDTAKGVRMLISQGGNDILSCVGCEVLPKGRSVPFAAIPTTSGTGSEATQVAVIKNNEKHVKMEFISQFLLPDLAVIDPRFCTSMPKKVTAMTGLDAMTHAIESYCCLQKNPVSRCYSLTALELIRDNLAKAITNGHDKEVRLNMANASLLAGSAFSNSMVGLVHAIGHSLGGIARVPHGLAMAILLVPCLRFNLEKCADDYASLLLSMAGPEAYCSYTSEKRPQAFIDYVYGFLAEISEKAGMSLRLSSYGVDESCFDAVASLSVNDGAMIVNPRSCSKKEVTEILRECL
ncbi:MAG: iron-containing alcohol dehydrogenase [Bullifex sp.]